MAKLNQFFNVPTQWIENKARNTEENTVSLEKYFNERSYSKNHL